MMTSEGDENDEALKERTVKDSIYFMTIKIESMFISYLDDPNLTIESELLNNLALLLTNETFIDILKKEIKFKRKKSKVSKVIEK